MTTSKDLYDWFRCWTNAVSTNEPKPLNITVTQLDGKYPYKSKSKRLIKKWTKQHILNVVKYKNCKVDMSKVSDFGSCYMEGDRVMKVWYVCQYQCSFECGSNNSCLLFSTQEKAEEKFMELVDSSKDVWGGPEEWILDDNASNKMLSASSSYNSETSGNYLSVGSYELDSNTVLED